MEISSVNFVHNYRGNQKQLQKMQLHWRYKIFQQLVLSIVDNHTRIVIYRVVNMFVSFSWIRLDVNSSKPDTCRRAFFES
jgi:hypothetical protein